MLNATYLHRRGAVYYFRRKVPSDVIEFLAKGTPIGVPENVLRYFRGQGKGGKGIVEYSLKTIGKDEAGRLCRLEAIRFDDYLAELRRCIVRRPLVAANIDSAS